MFGKNAIIISIKLFVITAVAALCLAVANKVTAPVIDANAKIAEEEALQKVLSAADNFKEVSAPETDVDGVTVEKMNIGYLGDDAVGYVVTVVSGEGYGGDVKVMVGIDKELKVTRIEILESSETAGLGANASKPKFAGQYEGKSGEFLVVKGQAKADNEISAITSATVTSKAVTACVNAAVKSAESCEDNGVDEALVKTEEQKKEIEEETNKQVTEAKSEGGAVQ